MKKSSTVLAAVLACAFIAPAFASIQRTSGAPEQIAKKSGGKSKSSKPKAFKPAKA